MSNTGVGLEKDGDGIAESDGSFSQSRSEDLAAENSRRSVEVELLEFFRAQSGDDSPLHHHRPEEFALFSRLAKLSNYPRPQPLKDFIGAVELELQRVWDVGSEARDDEDKQAVKIGKALSDIRHSTTLKNAWEILAVFACGDGENLGDNKRDSSLASTLASCITHLWNRWESLPYAPSKGHETVDSASDGADFDSEKWLGTGELINWDDLSEEQCKKVEYHGGWALKRVREDIVRSPQKVYQAATSVKDGTPLNCSKDDLLALINLLGKDTAQEDGRFLFCLIPPCSSFLLHLHTLCKSLLSPRAIYEHKEDVIIAAMGEMAKSKGLRKAWHDLWEACCQPVTVATTVLLQQVCR